MKRDLPTLASEEQILLAALAELSRRLPPGWSAEPQLERAAGRLRADAAVRIKSPDGQRTTMYAEARRTLVTRDLRTLVDQLESTIAAARAAEPDESLAPLVVARYLAEPVRAWLAERDVSYVDATGNMRILLTTPSLFVRDVGEQKDPWRGPGRPKGNLKGESAARVVRALVDFRPPYSVPGLMKRAGTPSGNTYRVVDFLQEQGLLTRDDTGTITDVQWRALVERWSKDYDFTALAGATGYLAPRGLPELVKRVSELPEDSPIGGYAITGSIAAATWEAYAPTRLAMIYAENPDQFALYADLRRVDAGTNVIIAPTTQTAALERTQRLDDAVIVSPSQAAVDLLRSPGRGPEEGRALLEWMEKYESAWRQ